ncbi:MAG: deoxyguanosine kinase [Patiriisocius sp.]
MHTVYLGLGSNLGNRFEYLQDAINAIFKQIGSVTKISNVYETPAIGFEGAPFLNCVLEVQTYRTAHATLTEILQLEKTLGRQRKDSAIYESRPIDIDILLYNDEVINRKQLQVPHPEIQHRKFVLQPLAELAPQAIHPIVQKSMVALLEETKDDSVIVKQSKWLRNPLKDYDFSKLNYIAIEGNIGAGKTSLSQMLATDFNAKLILERFKDNPFLPKFYEDQHRYAFPLEMSFLADRYQQLLEDSTQFDLFKECVIADYDAYKSLIFAKVTLQEEEYNLYKKLFHLMHKELPKPDVYIYLYQNTERLLENIKKRGRSYEKGIEASYLQKINEGYLEFIKNQHSDSIKMIDISELDFVKNRKDYLAILDQILQ